MNCRQLNKINEQEKQLFEKYKTTLSNCAKITSIGKIQIQEMKPQKKK